MSTSSERGGFHGLVRRVETGMEEALRLDGEKLRALTGADHGPWTGDSVVKVDPPAPDKRAINILKNETLLGMHNGACGVVGNSISIRQSATESKAEFVRRIVSAFLAEVAA